MAVPTDDNRVKARLREIGEPITLFGERVRRITTLHSTVYRCYYNRLQTGVIV
jgi:pre-mRNA processing factor 4 (PRP4) like